MAEKNKCLETAFDVIHRRYRTNGHFLVCIYRDQEAAVMRANSWLYHYYMVQSKLQYGMQFEAAAAAQTSPRIPSAGPTSAYAYPQQSPHHNRQDAYQSAAAEHQQQQQQHHQHHQQQHQQQQQQPQQPVPHFNQQPDGYFRYGRHRLEPEPVDYSVHSPEQTPPPPPLALKIEDSTVSADSPPSPMGDSGGGGTATLSTSLPSATSLGRSRALVKAAMDPGDLMMETWNPSPPWSDCCSGGGGGSVGGGGGGGGAASAQKVPDVDLLGGYCGQPTPPTPGSGGSSYHHAPQHGHPSDEVPTADLHHLHHHHHHGSHHQPPTFTFDWPGSGGGEQYVPNVHETLVEPPPPPPHYLVPFPPWPHAPDHHHHHHHRLFPLQPPPPGSSSLNRPSLIVRTAVDQDNDIQGKFADFCYFFFFSGFSPCIGPVTDSKSELVFMSFFFHNSTVLFLSDSKLYN